jgi:phage terminase small subunit
LEAYCGQVATLRDAQRRLSEEEAVIADPKGNPIPHPALAIERAAQAEIRTWGRRFEPKPHLGM